LIEIDYWNLLHPHVHSKFSTPISLELIVVEERKMLYLNTSLDLSCLLDELRAVTGGVPFEEQ
jgi:hypothetical protein